MNITKEFISSVSVNDTAVKNGADLVKKKNYSNLIIDENKTFISGECAGSGKKPYVCSVDFINETSPVFRCTCPSRQIPCKHVIGLMIAFADGYKFITAEIPDDISIKREKKESRNAKTKEKLEIAEQRLPKNKSVASKKADIKKIDAQLNGIAEAEKIVYGIVQSGLGSMDSKNLDVYSGIIKKLDSYFIPSIQNELNDLLGMLRYNNSDGKDKAQYMNITEKICRLHTLLIKSKTYLETKKQDPDKPDTESEIEELIGHAWKLEELARYGLFEADSKLVELCFHVRQEDDKRQFVDEGFYISLNSGKIYKTRNYRPFKAVKYIKEQDSVFSVLHIPKLYVYPSLSINPRIRWEDNIRIEFEKITPEICRQIKAYAQSDYTEVIKNVKNQFKNLLLFPHPAVLVQFSKLSKLSESSDDSGTDDEIFVISDSSDNKICLKHGSYCHDSFIFLFDRLTKCETENNVMLLLFENDIETGKLFAQPLAFITDEKIVRLVY